MSKVTLADLEIILGFLASWPGSRKISVKEWVVQKEKSKISEENVITLVYLTEIQRNKLKTWIIYNILQIDLTNRGSFSK